MMSSISIQRLRHVASISNITVTRNVFIRSYISRAHPSKSPTPTYPIGDAVSGVLTGVLERMKKREARWERYKEKRLKAGVKDDEEFRNQNETIELILNLNLDPRKPGQSLRGSLTLPNGTGKKIKVAVFTSDAQTITAVTDAGASVAGGLDLIEAIEKGEQPVNFERALATPDIMPQLSKIARVLGPRGVMPNVKVGTIQPDSAIVDAVKQQTEGMVQYRAEKNGSIQVGIGKASFGEEALLQNIRTFLDEMENVKPESFGKGKKKKESSKNAKYYLKAYLTATQGGSFNLDLSTIDPTSNHFMETTLDTMS